jgi:hypothetical protein
VKRATQRHGLGDGCEACLSDPLLGPIGRDWRVGPCQGSFLPALHLFAADRLRRPMIVSKVEFTLMARRMSAAEICTCLAIRGCGELGNNACQLTRPKANFSSSSLASLC